MGKSWVAVVAAHFFVMPLLGDDPHRAAIQTFSAATLGKEKTISPVVFIRTAGRRQAYLGHHRPHPPGLAPGGNQPVT